MSKTSSEKRIKKFHPSFTEAEYKEIENYCKNIKKISPASWLRQIAFENIQKYEKEQ